MASVRESMSYTQTRSGINPPFKKKKKKVQMCFYVEGRQFLKKKMLPGWIVP